MKKESTLINNTIKTIKEEIASKKVKDKTCVLSIRMRIEDREKLKRKLAKHGIKYQTLIKELLHKIAEM